MVKIGYQLPACLVSFAAGLYGPGPELLPSEGDGYMIFTSARDLAHDNQKGGLHKIQLAMSLMSYFYIYSPK